MLKFNERAVLGFFYSLSCPMLRGREFLKECFLVGLEDSCKMQYLHKGVFWDVSLRMNEEVANIEKCIRVLFDRWWAKNKIGGLFETKPLPKEAIQTLFEKFKMNADFESYIPIEERTFSVMDRLFGAY